MLNFIRDNAQSWVVKIIFALIIFVFVFWGVGNMHQDNAGVLAVMGKEKIMIKDVADAEIQQIEMLRARIPDLTEQQLRSLGLRQQVFQRLIIEKLLWNEADKLGLVATKAELLREASKNNAFLNEKGQFDPERYKKILLASKITPAVYEAGVSKEIVLRKLQEYVELPSKVDPKSARERFELAGEMRTIRYVPFKSADYLDKVQVSDAEIQEYYSNNEAIFMLPTKIKLEYLSLSPLSLSKGLQVSEEEIAEYYDKNKEALFSRPERAKARHILISLPELADEAAAKEAGSKAEALIKELRAGGDFAALAKANSRDGSAAEGGELGWLQRGDTVQAFDEALFTLKPGEISGPVRTQFGFHIIKLEDYQAAGFRSLAEAHDEIRDILSMDKGKNLVLDAQLKAADALTNGLTFEQIAEDLKVEPRKTDLVTKEAAAALLGLKPDMLDRLDMLSADNPMLDAPLQTNDGYVLIRLEKSEPAHVEPLEAVKGRIAETLRAQSAARLALRDAEEALKGFSGQSAPPAFASKVVESEAIRRDMEPQSLAGSSELVAAVFKAKNTDWLSRVFAVNDGTVIAAKGRVEPVDPAEWDKVSERVINAIEEARRKELFQLYLEELLRLHPVEIVNQDFLVNNNNS